VALEPILVSTLFIAHLAIPTKLLQALCFDTVGNGLGRPKLCKETTYSEYK
jgi:hypothetical protein